MAALVAPHHRKILHLSRPLIISRRSSKMNKALPQHHPAVGVHNLHPRSLPIFSFVLFMLCFSISGTYAQSNLNIYGYFSYEMEKSWNHPRLNTDESIQREYSPASFENHSLNLITQFAMNDNTRFFLSIDGKNDKKVAIANSWGEYSASRYFTVRFGKTYRKFGLYNELLDAAPTYFGIDPPEHFSDEHLLLSRTTAVMIYGNTDLGTGTFNYSLSTDNGQGIDDSFEKSKPLGWDLNYKWNNNDFTVGFSGYTSFGDVHSDVEFGGGTPQNGVFPWMASDKFSVFSGYAEAIFGNLTLQAEYVNAPHKGIRDAAKIVDIVSNSTINSAQRARFLLDPNGSVAEDNVNTAANYSINSYYLRAAYTFETAIGQIIPFGWFDYYKNPENIDDEYYGGDGEAGDTDTGIMGSYTFGIVYRPTSIIAVKIENENHFMDFNKAGRVYSSDLRLNVSYVFGQ